MLAVTSARATLAGVLLSAALAVALAAPQPDLRPIMPEVDGVHPVRALIALQDAFAPGVGFLDKYPPMGSFLFGLAARAGDVDELATQARTIASSPVGERRLQLWAVRHEVQGALARERWLSRLAMGAAAALVFLLSRRLAGPPGAAPWWTLVGPLLAAALFTAWGPTRVYAGTANVDALALLPALGALLLLLQARWVTAGAALALAVALKDPQVVLVPVVLGGAAWLGGRRALLRAAVAAAAVYAVASGALTSPATWWEHVHYLAAGGVESVADRVDRGDPASWGRLLQHVGALLFLYDGLMALIILAACLRRIPAEPVARRTWWLILAGAFAPVLLFVLPVGFVYARFLLLTQALLLACCGAAGARSIERAVEKRSPWLWLGALAWPVFLATLGAYLWVMGTVWYPSSDPRREVVVWLHREAPEGGSVQLFADEREHGPSLDPALWTLDTRGLGEVGPALAALRERGVAERPEWVLVMSFDNDPPSGAPSPPDALPSPGDVVAGLYTVRRVLGISPHGWLESSIAVQPRITVLQRAD
jgi:hypothetical protein